MGAHGSKRPQKMLLSKPRLHCYQFSVFTISSAPSCCLLTLSLPPPVTTTLLHISPAPAWISCTQGWSHAKWPWWGLSAQDLPAISLGFRQDQRNLPPRCASAVWGHVGIEEPPCQPKPTETHAAIPSSRPCCVRSLCTNYYVYISLWPPCQK